MTTQPRSSAAERRAISRAARDAFPPMGIYAIRDEGSGVVRVRASRDVYGAINRAQFELRLGSHADRALQSGWNRDPAGFRFEVLELVRERKEPGFDHAGELRLLEELHRAELCAGGRP